MDSGLEKNLNSSLPMGQVTLKFCLPRYFTPLPRFSNLFKIHDDGLPWPLPLRQESMKSHLSSRKIYLSRTTGQGFCWALMVHVKMVMGTTLEKRNKFQRFILHLLPSLTLSHFHLNKQNVTDETVLYKKNHWNNKTKEWSKVVVWNSTNNLHSQDT